MPPAAAQSRRCCHIAVLGAHDQSRETTPGFPLTWGRVLAETAPGNHTPGPTSLDHTAALALLMVCSESLLSITCSLAPSSQTQTLMMSSSKRTLLSDAVGARKAPGLTKALAMPSEQT
ncbi:unnamed protein product, partial [Ectocarpus sp. 13 AM-2016]